MAVDAGSKARRGRKPPQYGAKPLLPPLPDLDDPAVEAAAHELLLDLACRMYPSVPSAAAAAGRDDSDGGDNGSHLLLAEASPACPSSAGPSQAPLDGATDALPGGGPCCASSAPPPLAASAGSQTSAAAAMAPGGGRATGSSSGSCPSLERGQVLLAAQLLYDISLLQQAGALAGGSGSGPGAGPGTALPGPGATSLNAGPDKQVLAALWQGDVAAAVGVAVGHGMLGPEVVALSAAAGGPYWAAVSRLYAAQQEAGGAAGEAALQLVALGERPAAAGVLQRAGLGWEAAQVAGGGGAGGSG